VAKRATIADLARAAEVSMATVDRVINRRLPVSGATAARVMAAAEAIGYHGAGLIRRRLAEAPRRTFGFLLQKRHDSFYQGLAQALGEAVRQAGEIDGRAVIEFCDDIAPAVVAGRLRDLAPRVDALAVVAVDHPAVNEAVDAAARAGTPVFTLLSDLAAPGRAGTLAVDRRKAGRTAAWAISRLAPRPGKIGILIGSHRYLSQELSEISLRSYVRELAPAFTVLEPLINLEDEGIAYRAVGELIAATPDLVGIYVAGGGAAGLVRAVRDAGAAARLVCICNELTPLTRGALLDGTLAMLLATPIATLAQRAVEAMERAVAGNAGRVEVLLPAEMMVAENL